MITVGWFIAALGLGALLCAPGCRASKGQGALQSDWVTLGAPPPVSSNSTRGLEVQMWIMDNTEHAVARALGEFDTQSEVIDEDERQRWRANGYRWCVVPVDRVLDVLGTLRPIQPVRVQWLGEFPQWRPIVRGGMLQGQRVRAGDSEARVERGKPRVIARSWIQPMMGELGVEPGVRIDLGVQIELERSPYQDLLGDERLPMIDDLGPVLDGLLAGVHADGRHALMLVGASPDADWSLLNDELDKDQPKEDAIGPSRLSDPAADVNQAAGDSESTALVKSGQGNASPRAQAGPIAGAKEESLRTLGEIMLTSKGSGPRVAQRVYDPPRSVIVVLIPRTEGGYRLLPERSNGKETP